VIVDGLPAELRERPQWVGWRYEPRKRKGKPDEWTKVPYRADGAGRAKSDDPATWATFAEAITAADFLGLDGVGYVLSADDPYVGSDLDECLDGDTLHPDAAAIVAALDSYTEVSPGGHGVKVIVRGSLDGFPRRRKPRASWGDEFAVYDRERFFTTTGLLLRGCPSTIGPRQEQLDQVLELVFGKQAPPAAPLPPQPLDVDDQALLDRAFSARNGDAFRRLHDGDTTGYASPSEADLAYCRTAAFWTDRDPSRIDAWLRSSSLYRSKWERVDYRESTIAKAIEGTTDTYTPAEGSDEPKPLRTLRGDEIEMRSIEWRDKPLLQGSAFHLAAGPKGVGKGTWLARQIADTTQGRLGPNRNVLIVSSEDSASIDLKPRLVAADADHTRWHLVVEALVLPRDLYRIEGLAARLGDVGLIVLDPVGNHLGGIDTDKEGLVRFAIGGLNQLADDLACMIVGVRHLAKLRIHGALAAVLGSTAWVDVPRAVLAFAHDDEDEMVFHVQVVAGNRSGRTAARAYRIELRDVGLKEPITCAVSIGESLKSVDDLLAAPRRESKSADARELILDILETDGDQESDTLDARIAAETGLTAKTVRNLRGELVNAGLIKSIAESDELFGAVARWKVARTAAPRPGSEEVSS
jgi:hypothetical protein